MSFDFAGKSGSVTFRHNREAVFIHFHDGRQHIHQAFGREVVKLGQVMFERANRWPVLSTKVRRVTSLRLSSSLYFLACVWANLSMQAISKGESGCPRP